MLCEVTAEAVEGVFEVLSKCISVENEADIALQCLVKIVHLLHLNPNYVNQV